LNILGGLKVVWETTIEEILELEGNIAETSQRGKVVNFCNAT